MKTIFIVNPVAGGRDISDDLERALPQAAEQAGLAPDQYCVVRTKTSGHARQEAEEIAASGEEVRLFAVGGDGTLSEVLSGAYRYPNAAVGCLPYGSGNDFVRNFGTRDEFFDLADQLAGGVVEIDLFQTDFGVGADICSAGLDAQIAYNIPKYRRLPLCGGETAYRLSILEQLTKPLGRELEIVLDDEVIRGNCLMAAVCNGGYYGGGFYAAPECRMDDGMLDVMVVRKMNLLRIAKVLPVYQKGLHMKDGRIIPELQDILDFRRCKDVRIRIVDDRKEPFIVNVDGECRPSTGLSVKLLPRAGRIVLPAKVFARQHEHLTV